MIERAYQKGSVISFDRESEEQKDKRLFFQTCRILGLGAHISHTADYCTESFGRKEDLRLLRYLVLHLLVQDDMGHLCTSLKPEVFLEECRQWSRSFREGEERDSFYKELESVLDETGREIPRLLVNNPALFSSKENSLIPFFAPYTDSPEYFYLQRNYRDEKTLISSLEQRLEKGKALDISSSSEDREHILQNITSGSPYEKSPEILKQAFNMAMDNRLLIISGGPGTGKTTLVTYLLRALLLLALEQKQPLDIAVSAPTGRAAMRVLESLNQERERGGHKTDDLLPDTCYTLHRLLGLYGGQTRSSDKPPLLQDVIIVDEASMVDIHLMGELFSRLLPSTLLVLVGDKDQLPSVDSGALLGDFLHGSGRSGHRLEGKVLLLEQVYRSSRDILELARPVKEGDSEKTLNILERCRIASLHEDLFTGAAVTYASLPESGKISALLSQPFRGLKDLEKGFSCSIETWEEQKEIIDGVFSMMGKTGILSPLRRGMAGADFLNRELDLIFSGKEDLPYHGRPVMVTSNLYSLNLFNGDRGSVFSFQGESYIFFPDYSGGYRYFPYSKVSSFQTSYVQTIHKSQGSEYEQVILLLPGQGERLLSREILYTGMTRAKKKLLLLSEDHIVEKAVNRGVIRNSRVRIFCSGESGE